MRHVRVAGLILAVAVSGWSLAHDGSSAAEAAITQLRSGKTVTTSDLEAIEKSLPAASDDDRVVYARILLLRAKGERKQAKTQIDELAKSKPDVAIYQATLGTLCFETISDAGMFEKMSLASAGRKAYERAIELDSSLIEPRMGLARFYMQAPGYAGGSIKKAEEQASALVALPEGKGELYGRLLLADIAAEKSDWTAMTEQFELAENLKGAAANPTNAYRTHAATLLNKKKDPSAALVVIERYKAVAAPDDASVWYLTGEAKRATGDEAGAIDAFAKAVELSPQAINSRWNLAELLEKAGRYDEAAVNYREFAKRNPTDARAAKATEAAARCEAAKK